MPDADVLVVGAGTAGCVLAARLADTGRRVLLLEAGADHPGDLPPELRDAATMGAAVPGHPANWDLAAELTPGRTVRVPRGRVVGGCSALYAGAFLRPTPADLDDWATAGDQLWSAERVLRAFRRAESDRDFGDRPEHGADGPVPVRRPPAGHPLAHALAAAAAELGFPAEPDKNGAGRPGYGPVPLAVEDGARISTATAYLAPRRSLPGLTVQGRTRVRRVVVAGGRAVGVETADGVLRAGEVILSAGAVGTPVLLLRSGIGPAEELRAAGVDVLADVPGVGRDATDHPGVYVHVRPAPGLPRPPLPLSGLLHAAGDGTPGGDDLEVLPWLVPFREVMHHPATGLPRPVGGADLALGVALTREESRGRITLTPGNPAGPPLVTYGYLAEAADRRRLRAGVRLAAGLLRTVAVAPLVAGRTGLPDRVLDDDAALDRWIRAELATAVHLSGTARMGPDRDAGAVVDQRLRVRGVAGLRVVDTSVLPRAPSRGPAATAVMLGERAAELMG